MPHRTHDTTTSELVQAAPCPADDWTREVVTRLPDTVQQQAAEASQVEPEATHVSWWQDGCTGPLSEWMLAEGSRDLLCQQIRGSSTAARYRACLPRVPRFLCIGHRKRPHLYSHVCHWFGMPATGLEQRAELP